MTEPDLQNIINSGENEKVEFKTSFNKEVIETIVAFSNTQGGQIFVGVGNNKKIIGTQISEESIQKYLNEIKVNTQPQIIPDSEIIEFHNKTIIIIKVPEYPVKPVSYKNKYYKRISNSNHLMSIDEITNEHLKTINSSWDFFPDPNHNISDISIDKVKRFIRKIEKRTENQIKLTPVDFLKKFEFIRNGQITFGAYLLFAKDFSLISDIQVGRFKSNITIIDSLSLNTDILTETEEVIAFIKKHLMVEYVITGEPQRTERFDYPLDAIREIVINMIVHRDYRGSGTSIIKIFDDKIEFYNPGKLFGGITIEDLLSDNYISQTRNKLIAKAFKEIGLIERYGTGIRRIRNICKEYGVIEPVFEEAFDGFKVTLFKEKSLTSDVTDVTENVTDITDNRQKIILELITGNNKITTKSIADILKITKRTVLRDIENLKMQNKIKRVGSERGGFWEVIK